VDSVNTVLASLPIEGADVATAGDVKAIVAAYDAVRNANDQGNLALGQAAYTALGLGGVVDFTTDATERLSLLNSVLDAKSADVGEVDDWADLEAVAEVVGRVMDAADGGTASPALSVADLEKLGLTGVTDDNLNAVTAEITGLATTAVDTF
jgi:hypothetical protein